MDTYTYRKNVDFRSGTSYPEQFLYRGLLQIFEAENRKKEPDIGLEYDIRISELNLRIEYSGEYWHVGKEQNDELRRVYCKTRAINYIEIIESQCYQKTSVFTNNLYTKILLKSETNFEMRNRVLTQILGYILKKFGHDISEIDIERVIYESLIFCKRYSYKIVRKDAKIIGTENKLFSTHCNTDDYIEEQLDGTDCNEIEAVEEEKPAVELEDADLEPVISQKESVIEPFGNIETEIEEEHDCTLVESTRKSTMSNKRYNQLCKNVMKNWNRM